MNMVFLWRLSALLCDTRAICGTRSSGVTLTFLRFMWRNNNANNNEPKTRPNRPQIAPKVQITITNKQTQRWGYKSFIAKLPEKI